MFPRPRECLWRALKKSGLAWADGIQCSPTAIQFPWAWYFLLPAELQVGQKRPSPNCAPRSKCPLASYLGRRASRTLNVHRTQVQFQKAFQCCPRILYNRWPTRWHRVLLRSPGSVGYVHWMRGWQHCHGRRVQQGALWERVLFA